MKKVGILTITYGANYGNRLQNYALQKIIESMGFKAETIRIKSKKGKMFTHELKRRLKLNIKRIIGRSGDRGQRKRSLRFDEFNKKYISFSKYTLCNNTASSDFAEKYDYFVVGSDQVWNARFKIVGQDINNYLASFAHPNQRIAYAASFGTDNIVPELQINYARELSKYKALSVRELSGVSLVKKICKRNDVEVVLDPTMLLSREEWVELQKKPQYIAQDQGYILTYFLSGRNQKVSGYIKDVAKTYNATIINLEFEFLGDDKIENNDFFKTTPDEFLWLINHAECILTDSFHATVFAIMFHKPFCTFERKSTVKENNTGGRIETLLSKFGLQKFYNTLDNPMQRPEKYEYSDIDILLEQEKNLSMTFLRNALDVGTA